MMHGAPFQENMMTASNLAICVGPSILWSNDNQVMVETNYSKNVSNVAQVRICKKKVAFLFFGIQKNLVRIKLQGSNSALTAVIV